MYFNYEKIRSIPYLQECISWNEDGNFDRVSAMDMVMILREDVRKTQFSYEEDERRDRSEGDEFIDANWKKVMAQMNQKIPVGAEELELY